MNPIGATRILVPTDFSDASYAALEYGCTLARAFGARLSVLHVEPRRSQRTQAATFRTRFGDDSCLLDVDVCEADASARLEQLLLPIVGRVPLVCGFIRRGRAEVQILRSANRRR